MNLLLESMTPLVITEFTVRVWREETPGVMIVKDDLFAKANELNRDSERNALAVAKALIALPRVNAVEVVDALSKHGVVLYRDWP